MSQVFTTNDSKETQDLGKTFAEKLKTGGIIALYGNLGSGKTTFVQGLAKGLGIKQKIISPTFIIVRKYELGDRNFYHIDLYRIGNEEDVLGLGLEDILSDRSNIIAIEWPEKIEKFLPKKRVNLFFKYLEEDKRRITHDLTL